MTTTELFLITLDSDADGQRACQGLAMGALQCAPVCEEVAAGTWTVDEAKRFLLSDAIKGWVETLIDDVVALDAPRRFLDSGAATCIAKTLVRCAFEDIDFHEVADHYLGKLAENAAAKQARRRYRIDSSGNGAFWTIHRLADGAAVTLQGDDAVEFGKRLESTTESFADDDVCALYDDVMLVL